MGELGQWGCKASARHVAAVSLPPAMCTQGRQWGCLGFGGEVGRLEVTGGMAACMGVRGHYERELLCVAVPLCWCCMLTACVQHTTVSGATLFAMCNQWGRIIH